MIKSIQYKVVSFDIFDTLLLRPCINPQEVWTIMEEEEHAPGFAKDRKYADAKTYQEAIARDGETTIFAAYDCIPKWKYMLEKEMSLERRILRVNPEVKSLWDQCRTDGNRRVIVSDMYLPSSFLKDVLRENGIDDWDGFYLSSDYDCRKSSGKLFEIMLQDQAVRPDDVLHIGDNIISDVKVPRRLGIKAQHYEKISDRFLRAFPFGRDISPQLAGILALGWHLYTQTKANITYWDSFGYLLGGVLGYMYVSWIVQVSKKRGIKKLCFVARDGFILERICNELYPEMDTKYIYAPRITSIVALGATGNDPWAIEDRKRYIKNNLVGVSTNSVVDEYIQYALSIGIDDDTAIVDGCSSGFSAQRLIERCLGRSVFSFYLMSMAKMEHAAAIFSTNLYALPFHHLSEFIFGAPTAPIIGVKDGSPEYVKNALLSDEEIFKMSVSKDISDGAVFAAKVLLDNSYTITASDWLKYSDAFMMNLTNEDYLQLNKAQNATDIEQRDFKPIIWKPLNKGINVSRCGRFSLRIEWMKGEICHRLDISPRSINHITKNMSVQFYMESD